MEDQSNEVGADVKKKNYTVKVLNSVISLVFSAKEFIIMYFYMGIFSALMLIPYSIERNSDALTAFGLLALIDWLFWFACVIDIKEVDSNESSGFSPV